VQGRHDLRAGGDGVEAKRCLQQMDKQAHAPSAVGAIETRRLLTELTNDGFGSRAIQNGCQIPEFAAKRRK
jgi:fructose-1-phosphate kinase PfkB-like protein